MNNQMTSLGITKKGNKYTVYSQLVIEKSNVNHLIFANYKNGTRGYEAKIN
jgi:hypothetical protein